jgi:transposase
MQKLAFSQGATSMSIVTTRRVFVGLDYHQQSVQVSVLDEQGKMLVNRSCTNSWKAIAQLVRRHGEVVQAAIEACCGAADLAEELSQRAGWTVSLAHPGFVVRMKQNPDKTDYGDARLLADLTRVGYLAKVWLAPEEIRELRKLVRYRQQLAAERRNAKLRISGLLRDARLRAPEGINPWTRKWRAWFDRTTDLGSESRWVAECQLARIEQLKREIKAVEQRLEQRLRQDAVAQKLRRCKGIGLITAATLRAEVGSFDRFQSGKQLARFCGLSPRNVSSGQRQADAGLIKAGNPQLRSVIIEAAQRLILRMDRWTRLACRLRAQGKQHNVVVAAVANRWMRWLYHQMQPDQLAV